MVQLTIHVRPQRGYTFAKSLQKVTVDSSLRVEELLGMLRLPKQGTRFFHQGQDMPLNSSLATHNVQDEDILETCSSPLMSSILSTVISDLAAVQKVAADLRTPATIATLLDSPSLTEATDWDIGRWSHEHVKRRSICCKMMKMVLQRQDRFAHLQVPPCNNVRELHTYVKQNVFPQGLPGNNTMEHCFKPVTRNRNGKPSLVWELLQQKLDQFIRYTAEWVDSREDPIESFLLFQNARHNAQSTSEKTPRKRPRTESHDVSRTRRKLALPATQVGSKHYIHCSYCSVDHAQCMCMDTDCPFSKALSCFACFRANHPILMRDHERISLDDARVKATLRQHHQQPYCPKYRSGPFAILCTLYDAMHGSTTNSNTMGRRQLSLTETKLKEVAQQRCASNLYDRQARGRTAFAGVELLCDKGLVRKETIPGEAEGNALFSLLRAGEELAKYCLAFDECLNTVLDNNMVKARDRSGALDSLVPSNLPSLVIDTREDQTFAARLEGRCRSLNVKFSRRDLPAGDYLFVTSSQQEQEQDIVFPIVIERKSWSDLADSVMGRGRRRFDCVRVNGDGTTCNHRCQLCRMKQSGCSKIMLFIEGARCACHSKENNNGSNTKQCKYCSELQERHGPSITQPVLEHILYKLQVVHHCFVHFTRDYNDTISSLLTVREILGATTSPFGLSYLNFCSNARKRSNVLPYSIPPRGRVVEWTDAIFIEKIHSGKIGDSLRTLFSKDRRSCSEDSTPAFTKLNTAFVDLAESESESGNQDEDEYLTESQDSIMVLDDSGWTSSKKKPFTNQKPIILIDEETPIVLGSASAKSARQKAVLNEEVQVLGSTPSAFASLPKTTTPLLLLTGICEYDTEYHKDIDSIWKQMYFEHGNQQVINFKELSKLRLNQVQDDCTPLVERASRMFWILYVQLKYDVIFHPARDINGAFSLRDLWTSASTKAHTTLSQEASRLLSPARATQPNECVICRDMLGARGVNALPCGHCFHDSCIQQWFLMRSERKCPVCNFTVGYPKDDNEPVVPAISSHDACSRDTAMQAVARGQPLETPTQSSSTNLVREARLRRFEGSSPPLRASPASAHHRRKPSATRSWSCVRCTFENKWSDESCIMCQSICKVDCCESPRIEIRSLARVSMTQAWNCDACTLENGVESTSCSACGSLRGPISTIEQASVSRVSPQLDITSDRNPLGAKGGGSRCGACGLNGHNRGSGTAQTCPAYNRPEEIELRRKKAEAAARKAHEAAERMEQLQQDEQRVNEQLRRAEEAMAALRQTQENRTNMTQSERRRLQKEKERAEKRARMLG